VYTFGPVIPCHQLPLHCRRPHKKTKIANWPLVTCTIIGFSGASNYAEQGKKFSEVRVRCQEPNGTCLSLRPPKPQTKSIHHTDLRKKKQRYEQTEMKLYLMPSSTGRLMIPEIPRMINCQGRQAPNKTQWNLGSTAMIYETTTPMPVLCPPISFTVEERSHYKLKAAGRVCYSEVTYHSNSRYKKKDRNMGDENGERMKTPAQHQIRRAMKFSCRMKINHMIRMMMFKYHRFYLAVRSI